MKYPGAQEYAENYRRKYGQDTEYHGAEAYASMYVVADALKRARDLTPEAVRDALSHTDLMTVYGPVKFVAYGKKTHQNRLPTFVVQWLNGKRETVWPLEYATAKYVYPTPRWSK